MKVVKAVAMITLSIFLGLETLFFTVACVVGIFSQSSSILTSLTFLLGAIVSAFFCALCFKSANEVVGDNIKVVLGKIEDEENEE